MLRFVACALLLAATPALADGCGRPADLRFAPGTSSATVSGGAVRGEFACYAFSARAGQQLEVRVSAEENNAVFQAYLPGWTISSDGGPNGATLPGAGEGQDATSVSAKLPANGRYLLVVGGTRGNMSFTLRVVIR